MKNTILSLLRDKNTTVEEFRKAADQLGGLLSFDVVAALEKIEQKIQTPLTETTGYQIKQKVILVPVLRAGLALLYPFMRLFPTSPVGFVGIKRDEKTALPHLYYENFPKMQAGDVVVILDPMIATGGSGSLVVEMIKNQGIAESDIIYAGVIAAPEGISALSKTAPSMRVFCIEIDDHLNDQKFIMPGLGDFGDRYFGS